MASAEELSHIVESLNKMTDSINRKVEMQHLKPLQAKNKELEKEVD